MPQRITVNVRNFYIHIAPTDDHPLVAEYLPNNREAVLHHPPLEPLEQEMSDGNILFLNFEHIELRLSENCIRQLFEKLPPEFLH